ncbi:hypothetical protein FB451DRAFT_1266931 [Mycena latifolia]|nr:hypothetical protein FB451DRAFT_1266931 [Mycena latifolia]
MEPLLPLELEREIFERAAYRDKTTMLTLLLVCHRVHTWIEPLLYRVLEIPDDNMLSAIEAVIQSKPASFFQSAVRHLFVWHPTGSMSCRTLLDHCSGAINICIAGIFDADLIPALSNTRPQRLALNGPLPPSFGLDHPVFLSVTHLDIYLGQLDLEGSESWEAWSYLASLPVLTHLALSEDVAYAILPQVVG